MIHTRSTSAATINAVVLQGRNRKTSLCRQLVVLLPAAYLLSLSGDVNAVWWSFPIAEFMSLAATMFFFLRIYRKKIKPLMQVTV